jgi:hypothetical protein
MSENQKSENTLESITDIAISISHYISIGFWVIHSMFYEGLSQNVRSKSLEREV